MVQPKDNAEKRRACGGQPKWAALIDDVVTPLPQQRIPVAVLRSQAKVTDEFAIVRDHNSPDDVVLTDDQEIDLAGGNVFYRIRRCDVAERNGCAAPSKLAYFVNDRPEITTNREQTGASLRGLFSLPANTELFRDAESPVDEPVGAEDSAEFSGGPVFTTREPESKLKITVNHRLFTEDDGITRKMTGEQIAALVYPENPRQTAIRLHSDGDREIALDEIVKIRGCEVFDVVRCDVVGGFEAARVEREVEELRQSGALVTLLESPVAAVVYHGLRTKPGGSPSAADVLVPVPGGYPGQMIDWAYLPESSPFIGRVEGSPQEHRITALEVVWRQISYHPHGGGGAPPWNPTRHGFHTYIGELLSWLYNAR